LVDELNILETDGWFPGEAGLRSGADQGRLRRARGDEAAGFSKGGGDGGRSLEVLW
jgi:hypothetical protein